MRRQPWFPAEERRWRASADNPFREKRRPPNSGQVWRPGTTGRRALGIKSGFSCPVGGASFASPPDMNAPVAHDEMVRSGLDAAVRGNGRTADWQIASCDPHPSRPEEEVGEELTDPTARSSHELRAVVCQLPGGHARRGRGLGKIASRRAASTRRQWRRVEKDGVRRELREKGKKGSGVLRPSRQPPDSEGSSLSSIA